jgi:hypothetical protein
MIENLQISYVAAQHNRAVPADQASACRMAVAPLAVHAHHAIVMTLCMGKPWSGRGGTYILGLGTVRVGAATI